MADTIAITAATIKDENNEVAQTLLERGYLLAIHRPLLPPTREEQRLLLADAVAVLAGSELFTREVLAEAPRLRVISRNGIGYDAIDLEAASDLGIVVTYVPDAMVDAVADMTLALLLGVARRVTEYDRALKAGEWRRIMGADLANRTLGLVGTGRIGMAVARRARAFRLKLAGHDPFPNPAFVEELGGDYLPLEELLEVSDYVSLHLPAMSETRGMFNAELLARMKPSAYLINCARGTLIDEAALLAALRDGRIAGAGLDVFSQEPPAPGSDGEKLMQHPSVIATPHVAAATPVTAARMGRAAMANLLTVLQGERPQFVANPAVFDRGARGAG